ncbi:MAG: hypothetical protein JO218_08230 [Burkholderiales bacterium]|nr:hypothetical protein [Burkholderiales bacterium]
MDNRPTRAGTLLMILGALLTFGGIRLMMMGDNAYFLVVGIGLLATGVLIRSGKRLGLGIYGATLAFVYIASIAELGANMQALLPRILMPTLVGLYLFSGRVRDRLE